MAAKKKKKRGRAGAIVVVLAVLIVALLAFARYIKTPAGESFLLDMGFHSRFERVRDRFDKRIVSTLKHFHAYDISKKRAPSGAAGAGIVTITARLPNDQSFIQFNAAVSTSIAGMGGRVISGREVEGGACLELEVGTKRVVTHRIVVSKGKITTAELEGTEGGPYLAILVDDFGYFYNSVVRGFISMDAPITITIIPRLKFSTRIAHEAAKSGREFLCHMPMEPEKNGYGNTPMLKVSMSPREVQSFVEGALKSVPGAVGMNNHMGSKATADGRLMREVLEVCKKHGLFFIDSMTSSKSIACSVAEKIGVPCMRNELFIDNRGEDTKKAMNRLLSIASRRGYAIGIMHVKRSSLEDLRWLKSEASKRGIELIEVSKLLKMNPRAIKRMKK